MWVLDLGHLLGLDGVTRRGSGSTPPWPTMIESLQFLLTVARDKTTKPELRLNAVAGAAHFLRQRAHVHPQDATLRSEEHETLTELSRIITHVIGEDWLGSIRQPNGFYERRWNITTEHRVHAHAMFLEWAHAYPSECANPFDSGEEP